MADAQPRPRDDVDNLMEDLFGSEDDESEHQSQPDVAVADDDLPVRAM